MLAKKIEVAVSEAVQEVVASGGFRSYVGSQTGALVDSLSQMHRGSNVLLVSSGTAALEILLRAAGVSAGHEVLLSGYDYPGNFWAIERVGARPALVEVEPKTWNLCFESLNVAFDSREGECSVLIASHLHGCLQPIRQLRSWCDERGILLIEDACQAIGSEIGDEPIGTLGHAGIFSFGGTKVLSAGRGGALVTHDERLFQRARIMAGAGSGPYEMSEMQATIIGAQLPWIPELRTHCHQFFSEVDDHLRESKDERVALAFPLGMIAEPMAIYQAGWLISAEGHDTEMQTLRDDVVKLLRSKSIPAGNGFDGFHRRSARRCRKHSSLHSVARVTDATWVIHHSVALSGNHSTDSVSQAIKHAFVASTAR